jgi:hypothetical protein
MLPLLPKRDRLDSPFGFTRGPLGSHEALPRTITLRPWILDRWLLLPPSYFVAISHG